MQRQELDNMNPLQIIQLIEGGISWLLQNIATAKPLIGYRKKNDEEIAKIKEILAVHAKAILDLQNK